MSVIKLIQGPYRLCHSPEIDLIHSCFKLKLCSEPSYGKNGVEVFCFFQFENDIKTTINQVLDELDIQDVHLIAKDKGALTPTIKARVEAAVKRSLGIQEGTM